MQGSELIVITPTALEDLMRKVFREEAEKRVEKLLSVKEAAQYLRVSERTILRNKHNIGFKKVGSRLLFKLTDLQNF